MLPVFFGPGPSVLQDRADRSLGCARLITVRRLRKVLLGAILASFATAAPASAATVTASFDYSPPSPLSGETVTFTSTSAPGPDSTIVSEEWDLDGRHATGTTVTRSFSRPGMRTVTLTVTATDALNGTATDTAKGIVPVQNRSPSASFSFSPSAPATGQVVNLSSNSKDPDGSINKQEWDFNNDDRFEEASGAKVSTTFRTPGLHTVKLRVTDDNGATAITSRSIPIGDRPPVAAFVFTPPTPGPGERVTFFSTSSDPDGSIAEQAWDLDNDGNFNDAFGTTAVRTFPAAGPYTVRLRVTDAEGLSVLTAQTLAVGTFPQAASFARGLPLINPFPIVRLTGTIGRKGARLRRLLVTMPSGAHLTVRCSGRGCPFHKVSRSARLRPERRSPVEIAPVARAAATFRVRRLERHLLRVGTTLRIYVTKPGAIGKYTRFRIRKGRAPSRIDRCLVPAAPRPLRCSA
jgi:PKD repeat protein